MAALFRIIAIIIVVWLVLTIIKWIRQRSSVVTDSRTNRVAKMLRCEHCGLYVPAQEAVRASGHIYCSEEHRKAGRSAQR